MTKKEYNGWFNYETWLVKLWMDNDKGSYAHFCSLAQEHYDDAEEDGTFTRAENAALSLSDAIKEYHEQAIEDQGIVTGFIADLIGAAMSEVNWYQIAVSLIYYNVEEEEEETEKIEE